jgi:hypothetical protein
VERKRYFCIRVCLGVGHTEYQGGVYQVIRKESTKTPARITIFLCGQKLKTDQHRAGLRQVHKPLDTARSGALNRAGRTVSRARCRYDSTTARSTMRRTGPAPYAAVPPPHASTDWVRAPSTGPGTPRHLTKAQTSRPASAYGVIVLCLGSAGTDPAN